MCAIRALNRGVGDQQGNLTRTIGFMESNQDLGLAGNFSTSQQQHTVQLHQLSVPSSRGWSQGHPTPVSFPPLHASPLNTTSSLELSDPAPCPLPHLSSSESSSPPRVWLAGLGFPGEKGFFFFWQLTKLIHTSRYNLMDPSRLPLNEGLSFSLCCWCSVALSYLTLCDPMDCSTPGFPVHHHLPEFAQTHVH